MPRRRKTAAQQLDETFRPSGEEAPEASAVIGRPEPDKPEEQAPQEPEPQPQPELEPAAPPAPVKEPDGDLRKRYEALEAQYAEERRQRALAEQRAAELEARSAQREQELAGAHFEAEAAAPPRQTQAPQHAYAADPFEEAIRFFTPPSQAWIRKHRDDLASSQARVELARAAHTTALDRGIPADTQAYFETLDSIMGYKEQSVTKRDPESSPAAAAPDGGQAQKPVLQKQSVAAPLSRQATAAPKPATISLKPDEQETARLLWPGLSPAAAYAKYAAGKKAIDDNAGKRGGLQWSAAKYKGVL